MTIDELKQLSADLSLVCNVMPHYSHGRQEGLSDEETARRAQDAFNRADNYIVDEIERLSVGDEEIEEAIEKIEEIGDSIMSILDNEIHPVCDYGVYCGLHDEVSNMQAVATDAIRALRAYQKAEEDA